jgi:hypothetical protein
VRARIRQLRATGAAGTGTLEYVAAIALACVVISSVVFTLTGSKLDGMAERAICSVKASLSAGSCSGTETPPNQTPPGFDPKPSRCKTGDHSEKVSSVVKILFFSFGENAGFVETYYSDGTVTYTATDGAEAGVTGGFGGKLDVGKLDGGTKVDFGAGVKVDYGSTWTFKDAGEAKEMKDQLDKYLGEQSALMHDTSGGYAIYLAIHGATDPPKPPSQQVTSIEVTGDVTGSIGLSLPFDSGKDADPDGPKLGLADAGFKFGLSQKWTQIHDDTNGSTTYTTGGELYGQVNGTVGPISGEAMGVLGDSMAITRDKDDQITKVTLVTSREGKATGSLNAGQKDLGGQASQSGSSSDVTVTTTTLDVTTPEQRALVTAWLDAQKNGGAVSPETLYPDKLVAGDPFQNLMYTNGKVSNVQYDKVTDKSGFAAEVKIGVAFGLDLSLETSDSKAVDATYLGAPGNDATRAPVDFPECLAK